MINNRRLGILRALSTCALASAPTERVVVEDRPAKTPEPAPEPEIMNRQQRRRDDRKRAKPARKPTQ